MKLLPDLIKALPAGWEVGIHYNYDTFLDEDRFRKQLNQLQTIISQRIVSGRAHYLRFDTKQSFRFLEKFGILVDESVGFFDRIGYRCGVAGCFNPYDPDRNAGHSICEIPMHVMDTALKEQCYKESMKKFDVLLSHIKNVGGALSIVFHPDTFHNPEFSNMIGLYNRILKSAYWMGAKTEKARILATRFCAN